MTVDSVWVWLQRLLIFLSMSLLVYVLSVTLYSPSPVRFTDVSISVTSDHSSPKLVEVRRVVGRTDLYFVMSRRYYKESDPSIFFVVDGGGLESIDGEFSYMFGIDLTARMEGRWCTQVTIYYRPAWSQRTHSQSEPDLCFNTNVYE